MDLLINFDSPITRKPLKTNYNTRSPLIPCPNIPNDFAGHNNPFDDVVNSIEVQQNTNDPFDLVLQAAKKNTVTKEEYVSTEPQNVGENSIEKKVSSISKLSESFSNLLEEDTDLNAFKCNVKEYVTERINYIERSISTKSLQTNSPKNIKQPQKYFRRSFSAGILIASEHSSAESSGSSYYHSLNSSLPLKKNFENSPKVQRDDITNNSILEITKKNLREEAERITRILNSIEASVHISGKSESNNNEDLLSINPPWDSELLLSDEEDSIGLPKLKTYRHVYSGMTNNNPVTEENIIKQYLKKRRSTDLEQFNEANKVEDTSQDFTKEEVPASSSLIEDPDLVKEVPGPSKLINAKKGKQIETKLINNQSLRPKRKEVSEIIKKGPMRAVVPLQKMSKNISSKFSSPFKNKKLRNFNKKDESITEHISSPIAASTPTKMFTSPNTSARLRGRESKKNSPATKKTTRSSSADSISTRTKENEQASTPSRYGKTQDDSKNNKCKNSQTRPQSAPDNGSEHSLGSTKRSALKAIIPKPFIRSNTKDSKSTPKVSHLPTHLSQDKENHANLRK